jgi:hypothetical protein
MPSSGNEELTDAIVAAADRLTPLERAHILGRMSAPVASWWGYAEGNATIIAIVVAIVAVAAIAYVARNWWRR